MSGYASGQPDSVARECGPCQCEMVLDDQPTPFSHYCHGVQSGNQLWISGTVGITADGHVPRDVVEQFAIAMGHLDGVLRAAGGGPRHIVKVQIFLTDIADRALINPLRERYFGASARIDPGRGLRTGRSADEGRDRSGGGDRLTLDQRKRPFASA